MMHEADGGAGAARTGVDRPFGLAVTAAFLFALGGVANWAQEFAAWVPRRVADALVIGGLALSVWSLALVARRMFAGGAPARRERWTMVWTVFFATLPPLLFLAWLIWMWVLLTAPI